MKKLNEEVEDSIVKLFRIFLEAEACNFGEGTPTENEYGRPFDPLKDTIRGPRHVTITIESGKVTFQVRRPKYSPITHSIGMSNFSQVFDLKEHLE